MAAAAIEVSGVVKRFGDTTAVDGVSLTVPQGSIYGLLGPNGAGKTTAIRMMLQIMLPDEGTIRVLGEPVERLQTHRIGYLPEERGLYKKMRVGDLLTFFGEIKGLRRGDARERALAWLERLGLAETAAKKTEELSKGMQQKVQFIATVIHEPDLIILDEPFSGLDPVNTNVLKNIILEYRRRGHTVVFSTHMMEQVEKLCEHICLIDRGRVVVEGTLPSVKARHGRGGVSLRFEGDGSFLRDLPGVESLMDHGNEVFVRLRDGAAPEELLDAARGRVTIRKFEVAEPSIHDIFLELVSKG
jgi:ABC-2 type transport system ATP-binding protein